MQNTCTQHPRGDTSQIIIINKQYLEFLLDCGSSALRLSFSPSSSPASDGVGCWVLAAGIRILDSSCGPHRTAAKQTRKARVDITPFE
jgi:hypothetical protein